MNDVITKYKETIYELMLETSDKRDNMIILRNEIDNLGYWSIVAIDDNLTFVDIIKGIIPTSIISLLKRYNVKTNEIIYILTTLRDSLMNHILSDIWIPRCDLLKSIEKEYNISARRLRSRSNNQQQTRYINPHKIIDQNNLVDFNDKIKEFIYYGINEIDVRSTIE